MMPVWVFFVFLGLWFWICQKLFQDMDKSHRLMERVIDQNAEYLDCLRELETRTAKACAKHPDLVELFYGEREDDAEEIET